MIVDIPFNEHTTSATLAVENVEITVRKTNDEDHYRISVTTGKHSQYGLNREIGAAIHAEFGKVYLRKVPAGEVNVVLKRLLDYIKMIHAAVDNSRAMLDEYVSFIDSAEDDYREALTASGN